MEEKKLKWTWWNLYILQAIYRKNKVQRFYFSTLG